MVYLMQSKNGLLLTALDSTIKRIETSFSDKWLYIGSVTTEMDMPEKVRIPCLLSLIR